MPLRVAERGGYIRAVNGCEDCPWRSKRNIDNTDKIALFCDHQGTLDKNDNPRQIWPPDMFKQTCIPVWCPLPEPNVNMRPYIGVDPGDKKGDETVVRKFEEPK